MPKCRIYSASTFYRHYIHYFRNPCILLASAHLLSPVVTRHLHATYPLIFFCKIRILYYKTIPLPLHLLLVRGIPLKPLTDRQHTHFCSSALTRWQFIFVKISVAFFLLCIKKFPFLLLKNLKEERIFLPFLFSILCKFFSEFYFLSEKNLPPNF